MTRLLLSFLIASFFSLTALSANCGMKGMNKEKCDMPNCKMEMKKENCKCGIKKADCKMPKCKIEMKREMKGSCGTGKCGAAMKKNPNCKMNEAKKEMKGSCGAGKCGAAMMKNSNEMSGNAGKKMSGSCGAGKCGAAMMKKTQGNMPKAKNQKKTVENCGCGMTKEDCIKMMPSCKYRDAQEAKK